MLDAEAALPLYAETLEQAALAITQNKRADAADLVQETFLQVLQELRQGCKIHHLPEHLMDVLCEHFFRKAAADRMPLSFEALPESIADETDYIDELLEREEAKQVRKGLALSLIHI